MNKYKKPLYALKFLPQDVLIELPSLLTPDIINEPIKPLTAFIQGTASRIISRFMSENNEGAKEGKLKIDSFFSSNPNASFIDLIRFISQEIPDEERMKALKSIFFMESGHKVLCKMKYFRMNFYKQQNV